MPSRLLILQIPVELTNSPCRSMLQRSVCGRSQPHSSSALRVPEMLGHFHSSNPSVSTGSGSEDTCSALRFLGEFLLKYFPAASFDLDLGVAAL